MLEAVFTANVDEIKVSGLTQWDRGQTIKITCPDVTGLFEVHFTFKSSKEALVIMSGDPTAAVKIPDELLTQPFDLIAYVYAVGSDGSGETVKTIHLPVTPRAKPEDYSGELTPTLMEQVEAMLATLSQTAAPKDHTHTLASLGAAPAGYGLGEVNPVASQDDCVENGFYNPNGKPQTTVYKLDDNFIYQDERTTNNFGLQNKRTRQKYNGVWGEWEWENPPMALGQEYRTTERLWGRPVYKRFIDLANLTQNGSRDYTIATEGTPKDIAFFRASCGLSEGMVNIESQSWANVYINPSENKLTLTITGDHGLMYGVAIIHYTKA